MQETQTKNDDPVDMEWVFNLPLDLRLSFLQGIADGDGFASIRAFLAGISTKPNISFIEKLLLSLGIETRRYSNGVNIATNDAIRKAKELGLFLVADGRLHRLKELVAMLDAMDRSKIKGEEKGLIIQSRKNGYSEGEITSILWAERGIARRPSTIRSFLKRHGIN